MHYRLDSGKHYHDIQPHSNLTRPTTTPLLKLLQITLQSVCKRTGEQDMKFWTSLLSLCTVVGLLGAFLVVQCKNYQNF